MYTSAKILYTKAQRLHKELYQQLLELKRDIGYATENQDMIELTDAAFALREATKLIEDIRKEFNKLQATAKIQACLAWTDKQVMEPIRTLYVTAEPDVKMYAPFPTKRDKEGWFELMTWMGVPSWVADRELVRPHYNSMLDLCTELAKDGKPLPPGVDPAKQIPQYDLKMKRVRGVSIA